MTNTHTNRITATELRPGHNVNYGGTVRTVQRVTIRNGFSGPIAVLIDWVGITQPTQYSPTARVTVSYTHTGFEAGAL